MQYVDQGTAQSGGLINTNNGAVYMGVDSTNAATGSGRNSVRITSTKSYNHGLVILDLEHMPGGICGVWPAFWMVGPNWPNSGEIDIIEGVNSQNSNSMTLHTDSGCSITNSGQYTGNMLTSNCDVAAAGQSANEGCQIGNPSSASFGTGFNAISGGVYATEWTSDVISIWFFPRGAIPSDIVSGSPNPTGWGLATASYSGACSIDSHFQNLQIVCVAHKSLLPHSANKSRYLIRRSAETGLAPSGLPILHAPRRQLPAKISSRATLRLSQTPTGP